MKDEVRILGLKYDFGHICSFLVVVFCGFYLQSGVFSPVYWATLLCALMFICAVYKGSAKLTANHSIWLGMAFIAYVLITQLIKGVNGSAINVVFSACYFLMSYEILINDTKEHIISCSKHLFRVSIVLLIIEAVWRFCHPIMEQPSFYKFKFNSIMYMDSNFVAVFIMCLIFLAIYLYERHNLDIRKELMILFALLVLTLSRATILTSVICAILFTNKISKKWKRIFLLVGGIAAVGVVLFIISDESNQMRFQIIQLAYDFYMHQATPMQQIFGVGFGQAANYIGYGAHLFLVAYILESGLLGILLLVAFWGVILKTSKMQVYYVMFPFFVVGFSMAPHFIPYLYCAYAIIIVMESKTKENNGIEYAAI